MSLLDRARADVARITSNTNEWGVPLTLQPPGADSGTEITGLATRHHLALDQMTGAPVNSRTVRVSISIATLVAASYKYKSTAGEVALQGHRISYADASNTTRTYVIRETIPDDTLGLIVCLLSDYID